MPFPIMKHKMHKTSPLIAAADDTHQTAAADPILQRYNPPRDRCTHLWKYGESEDTEVCRVVCGCCQLILWGCCAVVLGVEGSARIKSELMFRVDDSNQFKYSFYTNSYVLHSSFT